MEFRKEILIGVILTVVSFLLSVYYISTYPTNQIPVQTSTQDSSSSANTNTPTLAQQNLLTLSEVAKHNTPSDCWIIIHGKVLKITPYLNMHPGGAETITPYCGADATQAFDTKGGQGRHSSRAVALIEKFVIGLLGTNLNTNTK